MGNFCSKVGQLAHEVRFDDFKIGNTDFLMHKQVICLWNMRRIKSTLLYLRLKVLDKWSRAISICVRKIIPDFIYEASLIFTYESCRVYSILKKSPPSISKQLGGDFFKFWLKLSVASRYKLRTFSEKSQKIDLFHNDVRRGKAHTAISCDASRLFSDNLKYKWCYILG